MNTDELRELPSEELATRLAETKEELFNLRFQHATGQLENYKSLKVIQRNIARIHTVLHERDLGIQIVPAVSEKSKRRRRKAEETAAEAPAAEKTEDANQEEDDE